MSMNERNSILIVGSGGREHALGWKLCQSPIVGELFFAPGNAGTTEIGGNIPLYAEDVTGLAAWADEHRPDLTVVGPETPLAAGIVDTFERQGLPIFGPSEEAAQLEASKAWAVGFMARHGIPHPKFRVLNEIDETIKFIRNFPWEKMAIKASGLAAGKGVVLPDTPKEAEDAVRNMMSGKTFGDAGRTVVIQERLSGSEVSVLAFCDGTIAVPLLPAQDHKRLLDGDRGPNTGGMGAYAPVGNVDLDEIHRTILQPAVDGMKEEGHPYKGILFAGLMLTPQGPKVLEYNVRFGDPETQPLMMLLESDLTPILLACINGTLDRSMVRFRSGAAACVVLASAGYPASSAKVVRIEGMNKVCDPNIQIFHAGTGRVLGVTAYGTTMSEALKRAHGAIGPEGVHFEGMQYRKDIGHGQ